MKDFRSQSLSELHRQLAEARAELRELNFKNREGQLRQVRRVRALRLRIAHIQTAMNEKSA